MPPLSNRIKILMFIALLFGFFGCCCGFPSLFFGQRPIELPEGIDAELMERLEIFIAQQEVMLEQPVMRAWSYLTSLLSVGLGIAHLACFWGYLQRKSWAKQFHLVLAMIKVVETMMGSLIHALYFEPAFSLKTGAEVAGLGVRLLSSFLGSSCFLLIPVTVIFLIMTDSPKAQESSKRSDDDDDQQSNLHLLEDDDTEQLPTDDDENSTPE